MLHKILVQNAMVTQQLSNFTSGKLECITLMIL